MKNLGLIIIIVGSVYFGHLTGKVWAVVLSPIMKALTRALRGIA